MSALCLPNWFNCVVLVVVLSTGITSTQTLQHPDIILNLPGLPDQPQNFKQYSGYLRASESKRLHYWFVESQRSPTNDPLVLWLNGGPGCSSLDGLLTENGPFRVHEDGKTLYENPYSWNRIANVLYLESPAGVGFSYDTEGNYTTDDDLVASMNLEAIKHFMIRFPEYANRDFYITGESYAGIYIPTLMREAHKDGSLNLKGALIGNGYLVPRILTNSKIHYWYFHGIIGTGLWERLLDACCQNQKSDECAFLPFKSTRCRDVLLETSYFVEDLNLNPYNIKSDCRGSNGMKRVKTAASQVTLLLSQLGGNIESDNEQFKFIREIDPTSDTNGNVPCIDSTKVAKYLNRPDVQKALHIHKNIGLPEWITCSALVDLDSQVSAYKRLYNDMRPILKTLIEQKYVIWIFNGDLDTVCNFLGDEDIIDSLMLDEVRSYQPWFYYDNKHLRQIGGFAREFQSNLTFLTVKGAGHMVPTDQPRPALELFRKFLSGTSLHKEY